MIGMWPLAAEIAAWHSLNKSQIPDNSTLKKLEPIEIKTSGDVTAETVMEEIRIRNKRNAATN